MNGASGILASGGAFTAVDYVVVVAYLATCIALGSWLCRGQSSIGEYFLAGRKAPWILACVSIVATDLSAISYMGVPAWMYTHDLKYSAANLLMPLVMLVVVAVFIPFFHRLQVFTVYQFLETRFHPYARTATAILFLFQRGAWLAGAIYIPSLAVVTATGLPVTPRRLIICILIVGLSTTLYTVLGGMKAVIWTDFLQFVVMVGGLLLMMGILLSGFGWDVGAVWSRASQMVAPETNTPYTTMIDWSFNFHTEATVWAIVFFFFIYNVGSYGTDQVVAQRYFTMGSFRDIAKSVIGSGFVNLGTVALLAFFGLLLVVYYDSHPELAATVRKSDMILPHFVSNVMPIGVRGLILAAILAATMSSLSGGLNSFSAVGIVDLYRRHGHVDDKSEQHFFVVAKIFTLVAGLAATGVAIWISTRQATILETVASLMSKFIGPITGIFFLGVLTRRAHLWGVLAGALAGLSCSFLVDWQPVKEQVNWMWTAPFSCLTTFAVGYAISLVTPAPALHATAKEGDTRTEGNENG
jgi:SSS family transporter